MMSLKPNPKRLAIVVEDTASVGRVFSLMLQQAGFEVLCFADGHLALGALLRMTEAKQRGISIIFSDILMPNMSGPELHAQLRAHAVLSQIPLVFCSGTDSPAVIFRALEAKSHGFLIKPASQQKLADCLEAVFGSSAV